MQYVAMTHYWMIEASSADELAKEVTEELKNGAKLAGRRFVSSSRKHYQPVIREIVQVEKLDSPCLHKFEIR